MSLLWRSNTYLATASYLRRYRYILGRRNLSLAGLQEHRILQMRPRVLLKSQGSKYDTGLVQTFLVTILIHPTLVKVGTQPYLPR